MKHFFTLLMIVSFSVGSMVAQTIVGTDPENKNVVLEEFTGIHCVYCPQGHAIAQGIYDANPDDVVLINIHQGSYAIPSGSEPDFRTQWGDAISGQSGLLGYPAGTVNRHLFPGYSQGSGTAQSRSTWQTTSNIILNEPSYLNIALEATIVNSTRQLVVYVEVYYTGDSPVDKNFLNVALLQNNILGPQTGGGQGDNYNHKHMLRHLLTGQWGVEISETSEGTLYTKTLTYEIPDDYKDVPVVLEDVDVVAFVSQSHQEIISGNMAEITMVESNDYDAAILTSYVSQTACTGELNPTVVLKNYGVVDLTSLDFVYSANGEEPATYNWTGELSQNESTMVELPTVVYSATDDNEININCEMPNGQSDELPQNDIFTSNPSGSITFPQECYFGVQTLGAPQDITWSIVDMDGTVLAEGGPYETGGLKLTQLSFPEAGCYTLTLNDASGMGLSGGFYVILDMETEIIWTGESFSNTAIAEFAYDIVIDIPETENIENVNVYPNPISQSANIEFTLNQSTKVKASVYDMLGRNVMDLFEGEMLSGNQNIRMEASGLNEGIYFIRIEMNNQVYSHKVSIK